VGGPSSGLALDMKEVAALRPAAVVTCSPMPKLEILGPVIPYQDQLKDVIKVVISEKFETFSDAHPKSINLNKFRVSFDQKNISIYHDTYHSKRQTFKQLLELTPYPENTDEIKSTHEKRPKP